MDNLKGYNLSKQQSKLHKLIRTSQFDFVGWCIIEISGSIDHMRLKNAVNTTVAKHETFRTLITTNENQESLQFVHTTPQIKWDEVVELKALHESLSNIEIEKYSLYIRKFVQSDNRCFLRFDIPSMLADAESFKSLFTQIIDTYQQKVAPVNVIQYADFTGWQDEFIQEDHDSRRYWRKLNSTDTSDFRLPNEKAFNDSHQSNIQVTETIELSDYNNVGELTLLAAWVALLSRFSGYQKILVHLLTNGRLSKDFESAVGLYANFIPVHLKLEGETKLKQIISSLEGQLENSVPAQLSVPISMTDELFNCVGFEYYEYPEPIVFEKTRFDLTVAQSEIDLYKLKLISWTKGGRAYAKIRFDANIYHNNFVQQLLNMFGTFTNSISADKVISNIPLLDDDYALKLYKSLNHKATERSNELPFLHQLLERHASITPNKIAVVYKDLSLTYRQLENKVNLLANAIARQGIQEADLVAVYMRRSIDMYITIFAVLKVGAAFVPIDYSTPPERVTLLTQHTQLCLTHKEINQQEPMSGVIAQYAFVEDLLSDEKKSKLLVAPDIGKATLAYVMHTSGSTGLPKGVKVSHGSLMNYLHYCDQVYMKNVDASLVCTSFAFDLTITCLFAPIIAAKTVVLVEQNDHGDIAEIEQAMMLINQPYLIKLTPSHLNVLQPFFSRVKPDCLQMRCLVLGGENLSSEDVIPCMSVVPDANVFNEYGPTESTVGCCVYQLTGKEKGSIPIGNPIPGTVLFNLDHNKRLLPLWMTGELYIGGIGLAEGYLHQPSESQDKFIEASTCQLPQPLNSIAPRLYKSGDSVCLIPNEKGQVELKFMGRSDRQIKIRGHRIELGEIEARIKELPQVQDVYVTFFEHEVGTTQLLAYMVVSDVMLDRVEKDKLKLDEDCRRYLSASLPAYMIPTSFYYLAAFPLTVNQKIDITKLIAMKQIETSDYVAPSTHLQSKLQSIWCEVMKLEQVGICDNFFSLGGDSIRAVHLAAAARAKGIDFTVDQIFTGPTIEKLSQLLEVNSDNVDTLQLDILMANDSEDLLLAEIEHLSEVEVLARLTTLEAEGLD